MLVLVFVLAPVRGLVPIILINLVLIFLSDGCATAAGPRDLRLKHDGRSLPAPFLPVKVGSVDFPIEKGGTMCVFLIFQVRFVSVKSIEIRCKIGKKCSEGESSKQDKLKSDQERRKSEPRAAS